MRVALVNDLAIALEGLRRVIATIPDTEVAWTAMNGSEALDRCRADTPDLVLMDLIMPVMDGVESTRRIMQECPCPIVVVTATVEGNAPRVYEALGHGALDAVNTPVLGTSGEVTGGGALAAKIRTVHRLTAPVDRSAAPAPPSRAPTAVAAATKPSIVAIGASTGGPQALVAVLGALQRPLPCAIVVVQHLDVCFAAGLARWLADETGLPVSPITAGQRLDPTVLVAATGDHLVLRPDGILSYSRDPADLVYRPSADVFFRSLPEAGLAPGTAVLLTGMGRDGAAGLLALKDAGWHTIAQDEASSVVWGMPGAAVALGAAREVLSIEDIGPAVAARCAVKTARGARP